MWVKILAWGVYCVIVNTCPSEEPECPAQSPNIHPTEHLWDGLKCWLNIRMFQPTSVSDIGNALVTEWTRPHSHAPKSFSRSHSTHECYVKFISNENLRHYPKCLKKARQIGNTLEVGFGEQFQKKCWFVKSLTETNKRGQLRRHGLMPSGPCHLGSLIDAWCVRKHCGLLASRCVTVDAMSLTMARLVQETRTPMYTSPPHSTLEAKGRGYEEFWSVFILIGWHTYMCTCVIFQVSIAAYLHLILWM